MTVRSDTPRSLNPRRLAVIAAGGIAGVAIGFAAVYGIGGWQRNADAACRPAVELAKRLVPLARGEVAGIAVASEPDRLPDLSFSDASGKVRTLSEWRGRTVLLNLWATWCVPCRKEMPALDALQAKLGSDAFEVVTVNIDTRNLDKPKTWLADAGIKQLGYYGDPSAKVFQDLKAIGKATGMPTTLLIDPQGCELGVLAGPAEWASEDAVRLISAALGRSS
jgi:thiol-disulfide isomerase/thioredoxin